MGPTGSVQEQSRMHLRYELVKLKLQDIDSGARGSEFGGGVRCVTVRRDTILHRNLLDVSNVILVSICRSDPCMYSLHEWW